MYEAAIWRLGLGTGLKNKRQGRDGHTLVLLFLQRIKPELGINHNGHRFIGILSSPFAPCQCRISWATGRICVVYLFACFPQQNIRERKKEREGRRGMSRREVQVRWKRQEVTKKRNDTLISILVDSNGRENPVRGAYFHKTIFFFLIFRWRPHLQPSRLKHSRHKRPPLKLLCLSKTF